METLEWGHMIILFEDGGFQMWNWTSHLRGHRISFAIFSPSTTPNAPQLEFESIRPEKYKSFDWLDQKNTKKKIVQILRSEKVLQKTKIFMIFYQKRVKFTRFWWFWHFLQFLSKMDFSSRRCSTRYSKFTTLAGQLTGNCPAKSGGAGD